MTTCLTFFRNVPKITWIIMLRPHTVLYWSDPDTLYQIHETSLLVRKGREGLWEAKEVWWFWSWYQESIQFGSVIGCVWPKLNGDIYIHGKNYNENFHQNLFKIEAQVFQVTYRGYMVKIMTNTFITMRSKFKRKFFRWQDWAFKK